MGGSRPGPRRRDTQLDRLVEGSTRPDSAATQRRLKGAIRLRHQKSSHITRLDAWHSKRRGTLTWVLFLFKPASAIALLPLLKVNKALVQILASDSGVISTRPAMPPAATQKHGRPGPVPSERPAALNQQKRRGRPRKAEEGEDELVKVRCSAEEPRGRGTHKCTEASSAEPRSPAGLSGPEASSAAIAGAADSATRGNHSAH